MATDKMEPKSNNASGEVDYKVEYEKIRNEAAAQIDNANEQIGKLNSIIDSLIISSNAYKGRMKQLESIIANQSKKIEQLEATQKEK